MAPAPLSGLVDSVIGIVLGAIRGIAPQVAALLDSLLPV